MQVGNTHASYGWASIALHWLVVIAVIAMFSLGLLAESAGEAGNRDLRRLYMDAHIGLGAFVALLVFVRVGWSLSQPKPPPLGNPGLLNLVARLTHYALLLGLLVLVISGPLAVWSGARPINVFGWFAIPSPFAERNQGLQEAAETAHGIGRFILWGAVPLHILGTLKRAIIDRDGTLARMLWVRQN
jgi:cytochrome b561